MSAFRLIKNVILLHFILIIFWAVPVMAQHDTSNQSENILSVPDAQSKQAALERWQRLTPEQKERLREKKRGFDSLSDTERTQLRERFRRYQDFSQDKKNLIRQNWQRFKNLPPEKQRQLTQRYRHWQNLPPERKQELREKYRRFQNLPADQKQRMRRRWDRMSEEQKQNIRNRRRASQAQDDKRLAPEQKQRLRQLLNSDDTQTRSHVESPRGVDNNEFDNRGDGIRAVPDGGARPAPGNKR